MDFRPQIHSTFSRRLSIGTLNQDLRGAEAFARWELIREARTDGAISCQLDLKGRIKTIQTESVQTDLDGEIITETIWIFLGMVGGKVAGAVGEWQIEYDDPPPWLDKIWKPKRSRTSWAGSLGEAFR